LRPCYPGHRTICSATIWPGELVSRWFATQDASYACNGTVYGACHFIFTATAFAGVFSTSSVTPTPLPAGGVIDGTYPVGEAETTYYFSVNLKAGKLAAQVSYRGAPDSTKLLELELLGPTGQSIDNFYIKSFGQNYEAVRTFNIDNSGTFLIKLKLKGPEAASFKVNLGGSAFLPGQLLLRVGLSRHRSSSRQRFPAADWSRAASRRGMEC
jgi:hypothetical protein